MKSEQQTRETPIRLASRTILILNNTYIEQYLYIFLREYYTRIYILRCISVMLIYMHIYIYIFSYISVICSCIFFSIREEKCHL